MSRSVAREVASQVIFEYLFTKEKNELTFNNLCEENKLIKADEEFARFLFEGVISCFDELEEKIKNSLKDFSYSQIVKMDLAVLLLGTFEMLKTETDKPVIINEALKIAKKFSTDKSSVFINGLLSTILKGN